MAKDEDLINAEDAHRAIARAAETKPQISAVRERLQKLANDEERGLDVLLTAIRRLLHEGRGG